MRRVRAVGGLFVLAFAGSAHVTSAPSGNTYEVKPGETLARVAKRTGVPVSALAKVNGITDPNRVRAGQVLTIPSGDPSPAAPAGGSYTVKAGDTLGRVAKRTGVAVEALAEANAISDPNRLRIGRVLTIPTVGEPAPAVAAPLAPLPSPVVVLGGRREHRVDSGQTLSVIAREF